MQTKAPSLLDLPHFTWKPPADKSKNDLITDILREHKKIIPQYVAEYIQSKHKFVFNKNRLWMYDEDKGVWIPADEHIIENRIMDFIMERYRSIQTIPDKSSLDVIVSVRRLVENIVKEYYTVEDIRKPYAHFLNLQNCMLDPMTGFWYYHDRQYYSFNQLPFRYDADARCPRFMEFIEYAMSYNNELIELMRRFMAYVISDITSMQFFCWIIGATGTGKSRMAAAMLNLIGSEKSTTLSLANTSDNFFLADIPGKKLILINELDESHLDPKTESILKNITGFDPITVRKSYNDPKMIKTDAKTMVCSNNFPSMQDASRALQRRLLLFTWNKPINQTQGHKWFGETNDFKTELPGIFNWLMPAYKSLFDKGSAVFERNQTMIDDINDIISESNQIVRWAEENATITGSYDDYETTRDLHDNYIKWKQEIHAKAQSIYDRPTFAKKLLQAFHGKVVNGRDKNKSVKHGIKLRDSLSKVI